MTAYKKGWLRASIAGGITSLLTLFLYLSGQPYQVNKSTFLWWANRRHHISNCTHLR